MALWNIILLHFLNLFGILSVRKSLKGVEVSYIHVALNHLKNLILFVFKTKIFQLMAENMQPFYMKIKFSSFSRAIRKISPLQPFYEAFLTIFLQQIKARDYCKLINEMISFRKNLEKVFSPSKEIFENFEVKCLKHFAAFSIAFMTASLIGFFAFLQRTFVSFIFYTISILPLFVNFSCVCFFYAIMQFLLCNQKVLMLRAFSQLLDRKNDHNSKRNNEHHW